MELTRTPREHLHRVCPVDNLPLAERYLAALAARFGVVAEAVYFADTHLQLYVHAGRSAALPADEAILALFGEVVGEGAAMLTVEYIDHLTLWHLLSRWIDALNRLPEVEATGAKLYCAFDQTKGGAPRPMAVFATCPTGDAAQAVADRLAEVICARLKRRDVRDAVTLASVRPMLRAYSSLTEEEKFALARG